MSFKKLTVAASIAASLAAPAFAQSNVQIYGKLYPYQVDEQGSGATPTGTPVATFGASPTGTNAVVHMRGIVGGNSRLGFRGNEDLGGGLKAIWQAEGVVPFDSSTPFTFSRDTFVGLSSDSMGTFKLGQIDTIFKNYGDTLGILGVSSGTFMSTSDVLRKTGFGTSSASSFHLRRANSLQYESPEVHDIQLGLQYSGDDNSVSDPRKPRVYSMGVHYDAGPLYIGVAHEIHRNLFGGSKNVPSSMRNNGANDPTTSRDNATQFTVEWRINKQHKVEFDAIQKRYNENATVAGRFSSYKNNAYLFAFENRWTENFRTAGHIVKADKGSCTRVAAACQTDGLEATKYLIAAGYNFSKRTMAFAVYSTIKNGKSARFNNTELGGTPAPGEDIRQIAFGLAHTF